jgi:hypothetical protein
VTRPVHVADGRDTATVLATPVELATPTSFNTLCLLIPGVLFTTSRIPSSNRFAALEDLNAEVEINSAWETIRENTKMSAKENLGYFKPKKHKPWFNKGCSKLLHQRKQAKLQWLQDPSEINGDNLNNVRCRASRYFRTTKR